MKTFYDILEVSENAKLEEINVAYVNQKNKYNEYLKQSNISKKVEEKIKKIELAYKILGNPQSRTDYDKNLANMRANELITNLKKNTNSYNDEMKKKSELEFQKIKQQNAIKEQNKLAQIEKNKEEKIKILQEEINKQIEERKKQIKLEEKQRKKFEKEKIKAYNKYLEKMGIFKEYSFLKKMLRTIIATIIVFGVAIVILKIPIVKNTILNSEPIQTILDLFNTE